MLVHVAGAGAAGCAVARALHHAGWSIGSVACRRRERAVERCRLIGGGQPTDLTTLARGVDGEPGLILVSVSDRHIESVARLLSAGSWPRSSVALHLSGSVEVDALAPLGAIGVSVGGFHPLKSFVDESTGDDALADVVVALEGDEPALEVAEQMAASTRARPFRLAPGHRAAWHAAAAHAANHLVALLDQSLDLMEQAGLSRDAGRQALLPLLASTLDNLGRLPPGAALTGPVVRGDVPVVRRHLAAVSELASDVPAAYRALARRALHLAVSDRDLDTEVARELLALLERR